jgi:P-type Mg2+ transporter
MAKLVGNFWSISPPDLFKQLQTSSKGLTEGDAFDRLKTFGPNLLKPKKQSDWFTLLIDQFKSPLILLLLFAAILSIFLHDTTDAIIILTIIFISGMLGFWQEWGATNAVARLLAIVQIKATVLRDGTKKEIPVEAVVPGDIVILNAGDVIPGDCRILESKDLFVDEATLTGETFPVEKTASVLSAETALAQRTNTLWMGTHVISGDAQAVVVNTGLDAELGKVSEGLKLRSPDTEFERGVRRFGYFLMEITLVLVIAIFAINIYFARPVLDSFLFSLALAVGLTPQLLPAIISINLAHGAKQMAKDKVIVKRLASIENFGSMNVLCSDKTGTLTEGKVEVQKSLGADGNENEKILFYAYLNASYETGFTNPIDEAICRLRQFDTTGYRKQDEVPYDFVRKRLSILVAKDDNYIIVTKGALSNVLEVCSSVETSDGKIISIGERQKPIQQRFAELSSQGFRLLGIAYKQIGTKSIISKDDESGMTFLGFLILFDPLKPKIKDTIKRLNQLGISLKVITGDNRLVAANISQQIGLPGSEILTGSDLREISDEALIELVNKVAVYAEVEPNQKERIILALRKTGNVVGFIGDGINDASALHTADVGISVDSAVDVAKGAADIVLLEKDLQVLVEGVSAGRITFANTLKYVFMATSANFGNMFSMAGASLFLPFLPLLPKQILLTNLMTDFPEMTIAADTVDPELVERPRRWNIQFIRKFMITFGILSSVFDYLTFGLLFLILHANTIQFRTGWFLESVVSASLIVLVIRSRKPFFKSKPGRYLLLTTLLIAIVALILPFTPLAGLFGFAPLKISFLFMVAGIIFFYIIGAEIMKKIFYQRVKF